VLTCDHKVLSSGWCKRPTLWDAPTQKVYANNYQCDSKNITTWIGFYFAYKYFLAFHWFDSILSIPYYQYLYLLSLYPFTESNHLIKEFLLTNPKTFLVILFSSLTLLPIRPSKTPCSKIVSHIVCCTTRPVSFSSGMQHPQNCLQILPLLDSYVEKCLKRLTRVARMLFP